MSMEPWMPDSKTLVMSSVAVATALFGVRIWSTYSREQRLRGIVARLEKEELLVRSKLRSRLEEERDDKEKLWQEILSMSLQSLLSSLKTGDLMCVDVLHAFQSRALEIDEQLNCVVHFLPESEALALELDSLDPSCRGPLHGLPLSVKECFKMAECHSTAGFVSKAEAVSTVDCPLIAQLKSLGCLPYCQTNVPMSMCTLQGSNPLYGTTSNPFDVQRECGGSSSGEASLLAALGFGIGIGSDIGGSLRNPAAFCGCYAIKPTHGRHLSVLEVESGFSNDAVLGLDVVGGFMSSQMSDLIEVYRGYWNAEKVSIDPSIHPSLPFDSKVFSNTEKLRIGYFNSYGIFDYHKGCVRVVDEAVEKLAQMGHSVKKIEPPSMLEVAQLYIGLFFADGRSRLCQKISNDLSDSATFDLMLFIRIFRLPRFMQWPLLKLQSLLCKFYTLGVFDTPSKLVEAKAKVRGLRERYFDYMTQMGVDVIITPASLFPAPLKHTIGSISLSTFPYIPWNLLNFPAGIVPCSLVTKEDDDHYRSNYDKDLLLSFAPKAVIGSVGLPLAVQVVAKPFQEELLLRTMKDIDTIFDFKNLN